MPLQGGRQESQDTQVKIKMVSGSLFNCFALKLVPDSSLKKVTV